ncbi:hypothetical protein DYB34_001157 [Aphanomyces astaci]|uniref:Palmitoyl-protein thioesterase 1 n=1 Tax=Aphanomyces astaci TaxID=112090 RepID=A0A418C0T2_APHAT|nr:hypothetical protein DYB34_001157 [Aphanomyces astaci]
MVDVPTAYVDHAAAAFYPVVMMHGMNDAGHNGHMERMRHVVSDALDGGLIVRGYIHRFNDPPVIGFLACHSPLAGIGSLPICNPADFLCRHLNKFFGAFAYSSELQRQLAQSNFYRDPTRIPEYLKRVKYLPDINNEHAVKNATYKANFASLRQLIMVRALQDTQTLHTTGRLTMYETPGNHLQFSDDLLATNMRAGIMGGCLLAASAWSAILDVPHGPAIWQPESFLVDDRFIFDLDRDYHAGNDTPSLAKPEFPVVIMHGMGDAALNPGMQRLRKAVATRLGAYVTNVQIGASQAEDTSNGFFMNLDKQVDYFARVVAEVRFPLFLPDLNNEKPSKNATYKANFATLQRLLLVRAAQDSMVYPSESEWFGAYEDGAFDRILAMNETTWYKADAFGLQTLDKAGKITFKETTGDHLRIPTETLLAWADQYFV